MPTWSRANALLTISSALPTDTLIPVSLSASEAISQLFLFEVEAVSQSGIIDPNALLNQPACVTLQSGGAAVRYFHGIVQSVTALGSIRGQTTTDYQQYHLTLVPRFWFLGQTKDCRVFQNMAVTDILTRMFNDAGLSDYQLPSGGATRDYTVQFNETDLHFATRLMEQEGYFYFFNHAASSHTLVVANQNTAFTDISGATLTLRSTADPTTITGWSRPTATASGSMELMDYDPANPGTTLDNSQPTTLQTGGAGTRDEFHWPALTYDTGTVTNRAKWRMEAAEAAVSLFTGGSQFGALAPGGRFTVSDRTDTGYNATYALRSVSHQAQDDTWLNQSGASSYQNSFTCFLSTVNWRQPMVTPRPRMDGVHLALVLGPDTGAGTAPQLQSGEETHTDDLARVKIRFFWDHRGEATGSLACWARVVQPWAGNGWGAQFLPRVGTEVAVAFVDGDPDRPIVLGGVYNGTQSPIYAKSDKTKSGFRTRSSLSGGTSDFSEFTFDDKAGSELVFLHAQKDYTIEVEHDQTLTVDNCRIVTVKQDETVDIKNNQTTTIENQQTITVSSGRQATIKSGGDQLTVSSGDLTINVNSGAVKVNASDSIQLTVGSNSITINQQGVTISGGMVKISGTTSLDMNAPKASLAADATLTLKGNLMTLN